MRRKSTINCGTISNKLTEQEVELIKALYKTYHKVYVYYKWKHKRSRKIRLTLKVLSLCFTIGGSISAPFTNLITLSLMGIGVIIQGYLANSNINRNLQACMLAYTSYQKILLDLKNFLRIGDYNELVFLSHMKVLNDTIINVSPLLMGCQNSMIRYTLIYYG